ncbi:uncharacterized protein LOC134839184 [Symsagittifera roscoffensis]|uniref:uncharacterized protein LOC134839184 n=1 Tax=Symsagittifera roscoffensis TaxID=84072 RepID=UPI00307BE58A
MIIQIDKLIVYLCYIFPLISSLVYNCITDEAAYAGICLNQELARCCKVVRGDQCSRSMEFAGRSLNFSELRTDSGSVFVWEEKSQICLTGVHFKPEAEGHLDQQLVGLKIELWIEHGDKMFPNYGHSTTEFMFSQSQQANFTAEELPPFLMCMYTGVDEKFSDFIEDPSLYLRMSLSTIPPARDRLPVAHADGPMHLASLPVKNVSHHECRVLNISDIQEDKEKENLHQNSKNLLWLLLLLLIPVAAVCIGGIVFFVRRKHKRNKNTHLMHPADTTEMEIPEHPMSSALQTSSF